MGSEQDNVLSLQSGEEEFSGFSSVSEDDVAPSHSSSAKKKKKAKSVAFKIPKKSKANKENKKGSSVASTPSPSTSAGGGFDFTKLSPSDINKLREVLGVSNQQQHTQYVEDQDLANEEDISAIFGRSLEDLPGMTIEVDNTEGTPEEIDPTSLTEDLNQALFDTVDINSSDWEPPRLKTPEKGKPVSSFLANLINMACTSQCDTDSLISKYKVPQNCDKACPPTVNQEIWKILDKRAQSQDRGIVDIQNLVASRLTPIIKLAEILSPQIGGNKQAKSLLSDSLILLGQVQYHLSVRRRYMIRPNLKKKYHTLCNVSTPISSNLFGDDINRDIKNCDSMVSLGKEQPYYRNNFRGKMSRFPRRSYGNVGSGYSYGGYGSAQSSSGRYQPYPQRGQYRGMPKTRGMRRVASTASPNDQN